MKKHYASITNSCTRPKCSTRDKSTLTTRNLVTSIKSTTRAGKTRKFGASPCFSTVPHARISLVVALSACTTRNHVFLVASTLFSSSKCLQNYLPLFASSFQQFQAGLCQEFIRSAQQILIYTDLLSSAGMTGCLRIAYASLQRRTSSCPRT